MKIYRTGKVLYNLYLVYVMRARVVYITEKKNHSGNLSVGSLVMSNLRPANRSLVQQRVLLRGVGACGVYNCKIAKTK